MAVSVGVAVAVGSTTVRSGVAVTVGVAVQSISCVGRTVGEKVGSGVPVTVGVEAGSGVLVTVAVGVACVTAADYRWLKCDVKSVSLLGNCLLRQSAAEAGAAEVVLFRDGHLTEASASNVFVVRAGTLLSPPKSHLILPGITYDVVLELAAAVGIPAELRAIPEREVRSADELWLTSSTREVLPIVSLDGRPVGTGKPGPVFRKLYPAFQEFKRRVMRQAA